MVTPGPARQRPGMGRHRRPDLPGGIFHLTARTLKREKLFTPALRTAALELLARCVPTAGARLLAVAIMPNHLHVVVQQGERPLSALMQPLLRRLAHMVHRSRGVDGPVFWRPYASRACFDPDHVRNAIVYTHLNPVRANLCREPAEYDWTSHRLYEQGVVGPPCEAHRLRDVLDPQQALPLFASGSDRRPRRLRADYQQFVVWRLAADRSPTPGESRAPEMSLVTPVVPPPLAGLPLKWGVLSPLFQSTATGGWATRPGVPRYRPDLSDLARSVLSAHANGLTLERVRGRRGGIPYSRARHRMIRTMHAAGYRNVEIARFLRLSESAISKVICDQRTR
jgi:REP element-mobilizing transposase RayT